MKYVGGILFVACACLAAYVFFWYDITVDVAQGQPVASETGQIVNLGLAVQKLLYMILCCTGMIIGMVIAMTGSESINTAEIFK
jgi:hypothetical protein